MIGRFSVLSCANVANITSYYNGVKYSYLMYKNNGGINIDKLSEEKGDFKNGLEVSAEVASMTSGEFRDALYALAMFKNLHVENNAIEYSNICNSFNNRTVSRKGNLLVCNILPNDTYFKVGNVLYPGKYRDGLSTTGIIIELPMGQVDITPNREELQYSQFTVDTIRKASENVTNIFRELIQNKIRIASLQDYYEFTQAYAFSVSIDETDSGNISIRRNDYENMEFDVTIEGKIIPNGFARFLDDIDYIYADNDDIYKIVSNGRRYRNSISVRTLFANGDIFATKGDTITKHVTLEYYRKNLDNDIVIFTKPGLYSYKAKILRQLRSRSRVYDITTCMDFLMEHIHIKEILNADVPDEFIKEYRDRHKNLNKKVDTSGHISIRRYNEYGFGNYEYTNYEFFIKYEAPLFAVYASNTKEHDTMKDIAQIFDNYELTDKRGHRICPRVITLKKSEIDLLKNKKKFVYINDFLYLRNNFLEKLVTAYIISEQLGGIVHISRFKRYSEFKSKYRRQLSALRGCYNNKTFDDIVKYYTERGWYNKMDVEYFKMSDDDIQILKEIDLMDMHRTDVLTAIYYRLYGNNKQLRIDKPEDETIYKIIKRL